MRFLTALVRSAAYAGIAALAVLQLLATMVVFLPGFGLGMVFLLPRSILAGRRITNAWRRAVARLSGRDLPQPYRPPPPPPVPESDGFYRHDRSLYRSPRIPAFFQRLDWLLKDRGTGFDLLWHLTAPLYGLPLAGLPLALIGYGLAAPLLAGAPLWTLLAVPLGVLIAPVTTELFARWTASFLAAPERDCGAGRGAGRRRAQHVWAVSGGSTALVGGAVLELLLLAVSLVCLVLGFGLGLIFLVPIGLVHYRWLADLRRRAARRWSNVEIARPYRSVERPELRPDGMWRTHRQLFRTERWARLSAYYRWAIGDVASWRDLAWLALDPVVTIVLLAVPGLGVIYGIWGLFIPAISSVFGGPRYAWYGAVAGHHWLAFAAGPALVALALIVGPALLRVHAKWTRLLLAPTRAAELRGRVARLTQTRTDAIDAQAAEVRRIERDLHDGAQARLIAVGLTLGTIEKLLETDPPAARRLLAQARETSSTALAELRDLVRGIHPPVLSERGLTDALRALALDTSLRVTVESDVPGRFPAPVESAAYFAVSEAIANAARHARADNVAVDLRYGDGILRMTVSDDGIGGADPSRGTGLRGIERRLGTFDGTLSLRSPEGGPTVVTMEVPCALSSPRISSSSETA